MVYIICMMVKLVLRLFSQNYFTAGQVVESQVDKDVVVLTVIFFCSSLLGYNSQFIF